MSALGSLLLVLLAGPDFGRLDRLVARAPDDLGSGCGVLVVRAEGVVYRRAAGGFSEEAVLPIASGSKWLTGAVFASLAEAGTLSLDDPVRRHLPGLPADKAAITVRQLLAHTSGLPLEIPCRNDRSTTLEACAARIGGLRLRSQAGREYRYGGVSMHLAGRVAEAAAGKAWNEVFLERLAEPLGLKRTDFFAYGRNRNPRPAGDVRSGLDDYGRFLRMLLGRGVLDGRRVLSENAVAELLRDQTEGARLAYSPLMLKRRLEPAFATARYGLGVFRERVGPAGELQVASCPGALGFWAWLDLERGLGGVLLTRSSFTRSTPVYLRLRRAVEEAWDRGRR